MKCNDVNRLCEDYLSGQLPRSSSKQIEAHLVSCPHCAQLLLIEDQELDSLLHSSWHISSPPAGFADRVMQQVANKNRMSWLWLAAVWVGYSSLWVLGALLMVFRNKLTWVTGLAFDTVNFLRSMSRVLRIIAEAMQLYSFSTTGLIIVFAAAAIVFVGIGLISKEELA